MKRNLLEEMGLEKEQIDTIMREYGDGVNAAKQDYDTLKEELETTKTQLTEANTTIDGFKDYEDIKVQIEEYKEKFETAEREKADIKQNYDFNGKLEESAKKHGAKALKAVLPYLDADVLKASKNQDTDIEEAFKALKESDESAFLFGANEPINTGVAGTSGASVDSALDAMRAAAGLPPEK